MASEPNLSMVDHGVTTVLENLTAYMTAPVVFPLLAMLKPCAPGCRRGRPAATLGQGSSTGYSAMVRACRVRL